MLIGYLPDIFYAVLCCYLLCPGNIAKGLVSYFLNVGRNCHISQVITVHEGFITNALDAIAHSDAAQLLAAVKCLDTDCCNGGRNINGPQFAAGEGFFTYFRDRSRDGYFSNPRASKHSFRQFLQLIAQRYALKA